MRVLVALAAALGGCSAPQTSLLVRLSAAPGVEVSALEVQVTLDGAAQGVVQQIAAPVLPGTILVVLPDEPHQVLLGLRPKSPAGASWDQQAEAHSTPGTQATLDVVLDPDSAAIDGGQLADAGADLAQPADLAGIAPNTVIASDDFQRGPQLGWGTASDGQLWEDDANGGSYFGVVAKHGAITNNATAIGSKIGLLGPAIADVEVDVVGQMTVFAGTSFQQSAIARWVDNGNYYRVGIDGTQIHIDRKMGGSHTELATAPFPAATGTEYHVQIRTVGTMIMGKAWLAGMPEPAAWLVTASDGSFPSGRVGAHVFLDQAVSASTLLSSFRATSK